jgi:selenocysteine lyase/cysteine desulfurase
MIEAAHGVGALAFVDAVHYAPHRLIDVFALDCDFLAVSAYKFFGPHVGMLYGKREHLESLNPYKLRAAPETLPAKWMTGTQNHEGIAGTAAAVEYIASLSRQNDSKTWIRNALVQAYKLIQSHEDLLCRRLLSGLAELPRLRVWGITDQSRMAERVPTVSVTHETQTPLELATALAERGIYCWPGNHYALPFTRAMGLEPGGTLRIGLLHYNTEEEVDRLLAALSELV